MTKLFIGFMFGLFLLFGMSGSAHAEEERLNESPEIVGLPTEVINDVDVPFEIHLFAQLEHQGHAVVAAHEITRGSERVYRLLISRSDRPEPGEGTYMIFDKEWRLYGEEERVAPAPVIETVQPEEETEPEEVSEPTRDVRDEDARSSRDNEDDDDEDDEEEGSDDTNTTSGSENDND